MTAPLQPFPIASDPAAVRRPGAGPVRAPGFQSTLMPRARQMQPQGGVPPQAGGLFGRDILVDIALAVTLFACFGSVVGFYSKINALREAPGWALLVYIPPILWAVAMAASTVHKSLRTALVGGPMLLLVLWATASFQWSHQPDLSLRQGILFCCTYLVACVIAQMISWDRLGRVLVMVFGFQAVVSAGLAVLKPEWGVMSEIYPGAWSGLWNFKQSFGLAMSMGYAVLLGWAMARPQRLIPSLPLLALFAVCVIKSEATTALMTSAVATCVVAAIWVAQRHPALAVFSLWGVAVGITAGVLVFTVLAPVIFALVGKAPTLTGRTDIWEALEGAIAARPLLGWGYQAFWTDASLSSPVGAIELAMDGFRPPDAHSTPMDLMLQLGPVGLALGGLILLRAWWHVLWLAPQVRGILVAAPFVAVWTSTCFTESIGLYPMDFMGLVGQVVVIKLALTVVEEAESRRGSVELA